MTTPTEYWLTTPRLNLRPSQEFDFAEAHLRVLDDATADQVRNAMEKRLMSPARPNDTYAPKVEAFRGVTSLRLRTTQQDAAHSAVREIGHRYELLIFLTEAFSLKRGQIHRALGVNAAEQHPSTDLVLPIVERRWKYHDKFSTRTIRNAERIQGVAVTSRTSARFKALGLSKLAPMIVRPHRCQTVQRVQEALRWLDQSLLEKDSSAAVVKTCIGLESLFGFDKNEPLRQSISDRGAFLIARTATDRQKVSKLLRSFYDLRSAIVHGTGKRSKWAESSQQQMDRLLVVCAITMASLADQYPKVDDLRSFFDSLKWSSLSSIPTSPVATRLISRAYETIEAGQ